MTVYFWEEVKSISCFTECKCKRLIEGSSVNDCKTIMRSKFMFILKCIIFSFPSNDNNHGTDYKYG